MLPPAAKLKKSRSETRALIEKKRESRGAKSDELESLSKIIITEH